MRKALRTVSLCILALGLSLAGLLVPASGVVSAADELYERCNTGTAIYDWCVGSDQALSQSFTAISDHNVTKVGLYLYNPAGGAKTIQVSIVECDAAHLPTGTVLTSASMVVPTITGSQEWIYVDVPPCNLSAGVEYAVVAYGSEPSCVTWWTINDTEFTIGSPGHPSTRSTPTDSWTEDWHTGYAFFFEIWGTDELTFEYFNEGDGDGSVCIEDGQRVIQTFTAISDHTVTSVWLYVHNYSVATTLTVSILDCDTGTPGDPDTWTVLTTSPPVNVPGSDDFQWLEVGGLNCELTGGGTYAILAESPGGCLPWCAGTTSGTWGSPGSPGVHWLYAEEEWSSRSDMTLFFQVLGAEGDDGPPPEPTNAPVVVGGEAYGAGKTGLLAPWLALAAGIIVAAGLFVRRRAHN